METINLPDLPQFRKLSPEVVRVLDKIRHDLVKNDDSGKYSEFYWFAREYPRCYRYHIDCMEYRLESIYKTYCKKQKDLFDSSPTIDDCYGRSIADKETEIIYWDFESFLSSANTALDILARIVGLAYKEQTPPSFNKLCKKKSGNLVEILKKSQKLWVGKMKDYRDCFVHYTPVDTLLDIGASLYSNGWEIRCKLPINPNCRDIMGFKYSRKVELLKYAISTYKHIIALDKAISKEIYRLYKEGEYPKRTTTLFFLGVRQED